MSDEHPLILEVAMELAFPRTFLDEVARRFSPELARECAMSTSVGGIGPLLRERIFEQGDEGLNVIGVSLLYDAVWIQAWHEWGQINLQKRSVAKALHACLTKTDLDFKLTLFNNETIDVGVWQLDYGKATVYFLSAPTITDIVYPGPKDMPPSAHMNPHVWSHECRLKQSWIVGRGALQLMKKLQSKPARIILSETPTIFAHDRLVQDALQNDPFFADTKYIFNDHTPLEYAHPIWDPYTIETVKLDPKVYQNAPGWNIAKQTLDVTSLLVGACDAVYGVARKHADVMKAMPSLKEFSSKIQYVTNGVRRQDWQAPEFAHPDQMTDQQLFDAKKLRKRILLDWVWRHCHLWSTWAKDSENRRLIAWTRRITPYKRLDLLVKMLKNPDWKARFLKLNTVILVGGRVHQQDNHAQDIVYDLLDVLEKNEVLQSHVVTIDNFNVWEAPIIYQGVDGSIMLADDTREASATGFMKAQMNGAAVLATADGAIPEFVFFQGMEPDQNRVNGFNIPYINGEPTAEGLLLALESFDKAMNDPASQAKLMRAALRESADVGVHRTVEDMKKLYAALS